MGGATSGGSRDCQWQERFSATQCCSRARGCRHPLSVQSFKVVSGQDVHCGTGRTVGDYGSAGGQPKGNAAVPEQAMPMARAADKGASWDKDIGTGWQRGMER